MSVEVYIHTELGGLPVYATSIDVPNTQEVGRKYFFCQFVTNVSALKKEYRRGTYIGTYRGKINVLDMFNTVYSFQIYVTSQGIEILIESNFSLGIY